MVIELPPSPFTGEANNHHQGRILGMGLPARMAVRAANTSFSGMLGAIVAGEELGVRAWRSGEGSAPRRPGRRHRGWQAQVLENWFGTSPSSMDAIARIGPPQLVQPSTSSSNTRRNNAAQSSRRSRETMETFGDCILGRAKSWKLLVNAANRLLANLAL
jgi:hypothetical protein